MCGCSASWTRPVNHSCDLQCSNCSSPRERSIACSRSRGRLRIWRGVTTSLRRIWLRRFNIVREDRSERLRLIATLPPSKHPQQRLVRLHCGCFACDYTPTGKTPQLRSGPTRCEIQAKTVITAPCRATNMPQTSNSDYGNTPHRRMMLSSPHEATQRQLALRREGYATFGQEGISEDRFAYNKITHIGFQKRRIHQADLTGRPDAPHI